jgi:hypothetical protein
MGSGASLPSDSKLRKRIYLKLYNSMRSNQLDGQGMIEAVKTLLSKYDKDGNGTLEEVKG